MRLHIIGLVLLLLGCEGNERPSSENIAADFKILAESALADTISDMFEKKRFSIVIFMPHVVATREETRTAFAYMCGEIVTNDNHAGHSYEDSVIIRATYNFTPEVIFNHDVEAIIFVNRFTEVAARASREELLKTKCAGKEFFIGNIKYIGVTYPMEYFSN